MKETISMVLVIIGALIGAGFASGQEIYSFFYVYGTYGLIGIAITFTLISILIYKSLKIICNNNIENYEDFINLLGKKFSLKNSKATKAINIILNILLLVTFYIMIAGFGAYFEQEIGVNRIIGNSILAILCTIVFFKNVKGVIKISGYIVPILIVFIVIIGLINLGTLNEVKQIEIHKKRWELTAITYCSYNFILLIPVLITLKNQIKNKENIKYISIISGLIMLTLSVIIFMLLARVDIDISSLEMPVVYVISRYFSKFKTIYAFIILSSIFTTAISIGIGFLKNVCKTKKSYPQWVLFMCISSLLISNFGFSNLVKILYPIFGYLGIIQVILILCNRQS